ncbi:MAG: DUF2190 family protein [Chloroflexi bacterium]|nr:MAG: DUF2190 family protein [Chloroflexota bacterium]
MSALNLTDIIRQQVRIVVDPMFLTLRLRLFGQANTNVLQPSVLPPAGVVTIVNDAVQQGSISLPTLNVSYVAGEPIAAGKCVRVGSDQKLYLVNSSVPTHAKTCVGIAVDSASAGQECRVRISGLLSLPTVWSFSTVGVPVFIQANGSVAPTLPSTGFVQQVGIVVQSHSILIALDTTVVVL